MTVQLSGANTVEAEAGFQIRLIEAGEGHVRVHGDEEGVEVFGAVVVIFETGDGFSGGRDVGGEFCFDGVFAGAERGGGQGDVAVLDLRGDGRAVEGEGGELAVAEIEEERG